MKDLQRNLSNITPDLLDINHKKPKVNKMLSVLKEGGVLSGNLNVAVDIGCSAGFFCEGLAKYFDRVIGVDIDPRAIEHANNHKNSDNIEYKMINNDGIPMDDSSVDLVICNHVYEHVPSSEKLFSEIYRVLKNDGICYLGAASKLTIIEPHFKLPFLSWLPKKIAHIYMRSFGKGDFYYENLKTYKGILGLVENFHISDYTQEIISNPEKYFATDMITPGGCISRLPKWFLCLIHPFLPSYIFLLKKKL